MRNIFSISFLFIATLGLFSCTKERSIEAGIGRGLLQSKETGECFNKDPEGAFEEGALLDGSKSFVQTSVKVLEPGRYTIISDTVNGVSFIATGTYSDTGIALITLRGVGTPEQEGEFTFTIKSDSSVCLFNVVFEPKGTFSPATFTLVGSPASCSDAVVIGAYVQGVAVNNSNIVELMVDAATLGTWQFNTIVTQGLAFEGAGHFTTTGVQKIVLKASGTPATAGIINIPVSNGTSQCSFAVNVVQPTMFTITCSKTILEGFYQPGIPMNENNIAYVEVDVQAIGGYSIVSSSNNGIKFSGSGKFTETGKQTIKLTASGTPQNSGVFNFPIKWGSSLCGFDVSFATATIDWKFKANANAFEGYTINATMESTVVQPGTTIMQLEYAGISGNNDQLFITLYDKNGVINKNEVYATGTDISGNQAAFYFVGSNEVEYEADPTTGSGANMSFKVTDINTTTKTATITFQGTALDNAPISSLVPIIEGTVSVKYQ